MALHIEKVSGKTEAVFEQAQIRRMIEQHYPKLFEETEQSLEHPVDAATLAKHRDSAKKTAIALVTREYEDKSMDIGEAAIEVAAKYREFLENPGMLASTSRSMAC